VQWLIGGDASLGHKIAAPSSAMVASLASFGQHASSYRAFLNAKHSVCGVAPRKNASFRSEVTDGPANANTRQEGFGIEILG
jgi:hypothetical protein